MLAFRNSCYSYDSWFLFRRYCTAPASNPSMLPATSISVPGSGTTVAVTLSVSVCRSGPAAEVLLVGKIELVLAGERAHLATY